MIGVSSKKSKSFHNCVSCICLVEQRRKTETGAGEGGKCSYCIPLLNLLTKDSRSVTAYFVSQHCRGMSLERRGMEITTDQHSLFLYDLSRKASSVVVGTCSCCPHMALSHPINTSINIGRSDRAATDCFNPSYFPNSSVVNSVLCSLK